MFNRLTREQERELLELRSLLAQLKLKAAQTQTREQRRRHDAPADAVFNFANNLSGVVGNRKLLKLALLPARWQHRLLIGAALLAWEYYQNRQENKRRYAAPRRRVYDEGDVIEAERDYRRLPGKR